ncbi:uncharacterized protein YciI [Rhodococcus sp. OAS809]|uniref:YciI family protein n=1 Tax=Rhodococcus sp. OAS809 TaxID=2663874 RepID=UPI00178BCF19
MSVFVVHYTHPDAEGWARYLEPHLEWIADHVEAGTILASGPTNTSDHVRTATLIIDLPDRHSVDQFIETDPYTVHEQVSDLTVIEWDPIFGILRERSSVEGRSTREVVTDIVRTFG